MCRVILWFYCFLYSKEEAEEEDDEDETSTLVLYHRRKDRGLKSKGGWYPVEELEMASVNLQQDDIESINAINEDIDRDTDGLEETLIRPDDDRDIIACLPPRDRYKCYKLSSVYVVEICKFYIYSIYAFLDIGVFMQYFIFSE